MRYPIVLFDVGETLVGPRESFGATYAGVLARLGLHRAPEVLEAAMRESWAEIGRAIPAGADRYRHFEDGEHGYWLRLTRRTIERASFCMGLSARISFAFAYALSVSPFLNAV